MFIIINIIIIIIVIIIIFVVRKKDNVTKCRHSDICNNKCSRSAAATT